MKVSVGGAVSTFVSECGVVSVTAIVDEVVSELVNECDVGLTT